MLAIIWLFIRYLRWLYQNCPATQMLSGLSREIRKVSMSLPSKKSLYHYQFVFFLLSAFLPTVLLEF